MLTDQRGESGLNEAGRGVVPVVHMKTGLELAFVHSAGLLGPLWWGGVTAGRETGGTQKPHVLLWANAVAASSLGLQTLSLAYVLVSLPQIMTSMDIWPATAVVPGTS